MPARPERAVHDVEEGVASLERRLRDLAAASERPVVAALDGRGGVGKSTLAAQIAERLRSVAVVEGDDFYAGGTGALWDAMTPAQRADHAVDWRRQRPVLDALRRGVAARWHAFDWDAFDGSVEPEPRRCAPADVILFEGTFSGRPELADLVDLKVLLVADEVERRARLLVREGDQAGGPWDLRWSSAEEHYFARTAPPEAFDLIVGSTPR